jgi:hypothetical protein
MPKPHTSQHPRAKQKKKQTPVERDDHPPPEDELGGGDICSLEEAPSTDDDKPLD